MVPCGRVFSAFYGLLWLSCTEINSSEALGLYYPLRRKQRYSRPFNLLLGWVQRESGGEWEWIDDDGNGPVTQTFSLAEPSATPQLPSGSYRPKQSLGQNYLKDPNTVAKILRAFHQDATTAAATTKSRQQQQQQQSSINSLQESAESSLSISSFNHIVELGPGAGALTDKLVETYGADNLQCIEIDPRSVDILNEKHLGLRIMHEDVLQVDYSQLAQETKRPLAIIGNLPYYITSQILFALADASHVGAVECATVTVQWEVGQRLNAPPRTKDYGILSVVFQLYCTQVQCHFKIPPTVFYPRPKVNSALVGLQFAGPKLLRQRLSGVSPANLRRVVTTAFQQRRKTLKNSLQKLVLHHVCGGDVEANQQFWDNIAAPCVPTTTISPQTGHIPSDTQRTLPMNWPSMRAEELTPEQFVELTRVFFGPKVQDMSQEELISYPLGRKVWRKLKHGPD